jgi:imidazolonepropionase-like amidohydrolase
MTCEELATGVPAASQAGFRMTAHARRAQAMNNAVRAWGHSIEHATLMDVEAAAVIKARGTVTVPTLSARATTSISSSSWCGGTETGSLASCRRANSSLAS